MARAPRMTGEKGEEVQQPDVKNSMPKTICSVESSPPDFVDEVHGGYTG